MRAAQMFADGSSAAQVAAELRVSERSAYKWRRAWQGDGSAGLVSKGHSGARCVLDDAQVTQLGRLLDEGPAAFGYDDQRWTLLRVAAVIEARFGYRYTERGVSYLLERMGFSWQTPRRRSVNRDEEQIQTWHRRRWPSVKG